jgi:hypothetical protein
MGNGECDMRHTHGPGDFGGSSVESNGRASTGLSNDFNLKPTHPAADACAQSLGAGFLCRKPRRKTLGRVTLAQAVPLLGGGVHPVKEPLPKTLNRLLNPRNFDQVDATADDHTLYQANIAASRAGDERALDVSGRFGPIFTQRDGPVPECRYVGRETSMDFS